MRNARVTLAVVLFSLCAAAPLQAAALPNVTVTKTVGLTPPPACGSSASITALSGQTVYYCYTVTNLSNVTFTYNVADNILGNIGSANLSPLGTSQLFASTAVNFVNGTIVNVGTWYFGAVTGPVLGSTSAAVQQGFLAVPVLAPAGLLVLGAALLAAGLLFLRRIG